MELPRILIVDDSRMVRATIIKRIRDHYEFREEGDGEAGWQALLLDSKIMVVISDQSMPKLDGYGLIERIRGSRIERIRDLPIIMISGDEDDAARAKAKQLGATDFITKGTGAVELLARLDSLVKHTDTSELLKQTQEALAQQSPVDPKYGLPTLEYLKHQGEQQLALARRNQKNLSVMMAVVDGIDDIAHNYGPEAAEQAVGAVARALATTLRKEDTAAHAAEGRFGLTATDMSFEGSAAFARRLCASVNAVTINFGDKMFRLSLSVGVTNSRLDQAETLSDLLELAVQRADLGRATGGNRVIALIDVAGAELHDAPLNVEKALSLLAAGAKEELQPHIAHLVKQVMPLLRQIENHYHCGIPLLTLAQKCAEEMQQKAKTAEKSAIDGSIEPHSVN